MRFLCKTVLTHFKVQTVPYSYVVIKKTEATFSLNKNTSFETQLEHLRRLEPFTRLCFGTTLWIVSL